MNCSAASVQAVRSTTCPSATSMSPSRNRRRRRGHGDHADVPVDGDSFRVGGASHGSKIAGAVGPRRRRHRDRDRRRRSDRRARRRAWFTGSDSGGGIFEHGATDPRLDARTLAERRTNRRAAGRGGTERVDRADATTERAAGRAKASWRRGGVRADGRRAVRDAAGRAAVRHGRLHSFSADPTEGGRSDVRGV